MYDLKYGISGENPYHIRFVKERAAPLFESWGYKVTFVRSDMDFLDFFNRPIKKSRKHQENIGKRFGFPVVGMCGVQRDLKIKPMNEYKKGVKGPITQYIGIGIDEPKRLERLKKQPGVISLLEKYGFTDEMARQKCEEYGLLSPCYELSKRGGCWFCPHAKLPELKAIKRLHPTAWENFVSLEEDTDNVAYPIHNPYGPTLKELDEQIKWEEEQMDIFDFI